MKELPIKERTKEYITKDGTSGKLVKSIRFAKKKEAYHFFHQWRYRRMGVEYGAVSKNRDIIDFEKPIDYKILENLCIFWELEPINFIGTGK